MFVVFERVVPKKFGIEVPDTRVDLEAHHLDIDHAFEHVQSWAGAVQTGVITFRPLFADLGGVACSSLPTNAGQLAACLVEAQRINQFAANGTEGRALQQHHPLAT